jgi:hypothetical protein
MRRRQQIYEVCFVPDRFIQNNRMPDRSPHAARRPISNGASEGETLCGRIVALLPEVREPFIQSRFRIVAIPIRTPAK